MQAFHAGDRGSNPLGDATLKIYVTPYVLAVCEDLSPQAAFLFEFVPHRIPHPSIRPEFLSLEIGTLLARIPRWYLPSIKSMVQNSGINFFYLCR